MVRRITVLYSNTPNPIVDERLRLFRTSCQVSIVYTKRQKSALTLSNMPLEDVNYYQVAVKDYRGFDIRKILSNLRLLKKIPRNTDCIYAIYPDMLLCAVIYKIFCNYKVKIIYEIQDLITDNLIFKAFHNLLMKFCKRINLTSPFFIIDLGRAALKKSVYIGNNPDEISSAQLREQLDGEPSRQLTIGLVGNLRDPEQVNHIERILDETSLNVVQAGASDFKQQLRDLQKRYPCRLCLIDTFHHSELSSIYCRIDIVWAVYPDTYNYNWHIARRAHEAILLNKKLVIAAHAKGMRSFFINEENVIVFRSDNECLDDVLKFDIIEGSLDRKTVRHYNVSREAILGVFES